MSFWDPRGDSGESGLILWGAVDRVESDGADYEFFGFFVYGVGGVVGGGEGDFEG